MAKFNLNCEFDSVEDLREFLAVVPAAVVATSNHSDRASGCVSGVSAAKSLYQEGKEALAKAASQTREELAPKTQEVEQPKSDAPKRTRRTKAEIEASKAVEDEKPVERVVEEVIIVPQSAIEVLPAIGNEPEAVVEPITPPVFNFAPDNIIPQPIFNLNPTPTVTVQPTPTIAQPINPGLPADLLGALGGIKM